jgi:CRISPR type I-D-associated protein Csc2
MSVSDALRPYLGDLAHLTDTSSDGKNEYVHPALRNMGTVSIVLMRRFIGPAIFRSFEAEITSITLEDTGRTLIRAVPNKFKHRERANGLKILRRYSAGGAYPQNRHAVPDKKPINEVFDMNTMVFGDSVNRGNSVLPVKAAVSYSDGLSLVPYAAAVDKTFHNRASEDGTLFDAAAGKNSSNLFERHFILPGTLMVQVISTSGRTLPFEGLEHLMLSIGLSGSYGGQTSVTGVNVATHIVGIYASLIERPETSPYILAAQVEDHNVDSAIARLHKIVAPAHEVVIPHAEVEAWRTALIGELLSDAPRLRQSYMTSKVALGNLFTEWFTGSRAG